MWGGTRCFVITTGPAYVTPCVLFNFAQIIKEASGADLTAVDLSVVETNCSRKLGLTAEQATKLAEILKFTPRRSVTVNEESVSLALAFEMGRLEVRMSSSDTVVVVTDDQALVDLFNNAKISYGKVVVISPKRMQATAELEADIRDFCSSLDHIKRLESSGEVLELVSTTPSKNSEPAAALLVVAAMETVSVQALEDLRLDSKKALYMEEKSSSPEADGDDAAIELNKRAEGRGEENVESTAVSTESTTSGTPPFEEVPENSSAKGEAADV